MCSAHCAATSRSGLLLYNGILFRKLFWYHEKIDIVIKKKFQRYSKPRICKRAFHSQFKSKQSLEQNIFFQVAKYILCFLQLELKQNTLEQLKCQLGSRNVQKQVRNEHFIWVFLVRPSFNFITWHVHEWRTQSVNCSIFLSTQILF